MVRDHQRACTLGWQGLYGTTSQLHVPACGSRKGNFLRQGSLRLGPEVETHGGDTGTADGVLTHMPKTPACDPSRTGPKGPKICKSNEGGRDGRGKGVLAARL